MGETFTRDRDGEKFEVIGVANGKDGRQFLLAKIKHEDDHCVICDKPRSECWARLKQAEIEAAQ